jgi:import inner membrane translocase subunit TIM23
MFDRTGTFYLTGLVGGGTWGLWEGLRRPEGRTTRLRLNSILNACTRRGPFLANTCAVLALMYSPLRSGLAHFREVDDGLNSIAAATITGLIYKSTGNHLLMLLIHILYLSFFLPPSLLSFFLSL